MSGWIKLYRDINTHWIWNNSDYFKWWVDMLLEANYSSSKLVIKNKIYECNRGEKLYSLDTWAKRWNTNKSKVRRFFELLEKDNMIVIKNETQTTRVTICNYDSYQEIETQDETQTKRKRNANETDLTPIKESKEIKENNIELRSDSFKKSLIQFKQEYGVDLLKNFFDYWTEPNKSNTKMRFELEKTWDIKRRIETWAKREKQFKKPDNIKIDRL